MDKLLEDITVEEVNLEELILLGEDKKIPIVISYPTEDGKQIKAKALVKQLSDSGFRDTINELKSLQYLYLGEIQFSPFFILKLNNLKGMSFTKCSNISFLDENIFLNLNSLNFTGAKLIKINQLLKCPNLEIIHLYNKFETFKYINPEEFYHTIIDFKSFQKLRQFNGAQEYLMLIDSNCPMNLLI